MLPGVSPNHQKQPAMQPSAAFRKGREMDYAESVWNKQIDDAIYQLGLGIALAQSIIAELHGLQAVCNSLRRVVDNYTELDRADVEILANAFRDAMGSQTSQFIRTLKLANDETYDIYTTLKGVH